MDWPVLTRPSVAGSHAPNDSRHRARHQAIAFEDINVFQEHRFDGQATDSEDESVSSPRY